MKLAHEKWVRESLTDFDSKRQKDDELYAEYVDEWGRQASLDNWGNLTFGIISQGCPTISREDFERLKQLPIWLFGRIWPSGTRL